MKDSYWDNWDTHLTGSDKPALGLLYVLNLDRAMLAL